MTTQTKKFIDFGDIIAFRFRCKTCGVEMCIPLQDDFNKMQPADKCPNCHRGWVVVNEGTGGRSVAAFLGKFVESVKKISEWPSNCEITLEIKPDAE